MPDHSGSPTIREVLVAARATIAHSRLLRETAAVTAAQVHRASARGDAARRFAASWKRKGIENDVAHDGPEPDRNEAVSGV